MGQASFRNALPVKVVDLHFVVELLFWLSLALLLQNYLGLYLSISMLAALKRVDPSERGQEEPPTVTVLIPARNEEAVIARKLESVLVQDYPVGKLEIVVASDVSTDRTDEIVRRYEDRRVRLVSFKERHGKLGALDELIPTAWGEVVVVTDANVILERQAISTMMRAYSDPGVGAVSGFQTVELPGQPTELGEERTYRNLEAGLKRKLSILGCVVGAFGGFYSLRRECFRPIGSLPMADDVILPLEVLAQGRSVKFVLEAIAYEGIGESTSEEFHRRSRMAAYNLNAVGRAMKLGWRAGILPFYVVFSYKILRWLSPFLWAIFLVTSFLHPTEGALNVVMLSAVELGMLAVLLGWIGEVFHIYLGPVRKIYYFAAMNLASAFGLILLMRGIKRHWASRAG